MAIAKQHNGGLLWAAAPLAAVRCQKRTAALISQNRRKDWTKCEMSMTNYLPLPTVFFFPRQGQIIEYE